MTGPRSMLEWALDYARGGIEVIPCKWWPGKGTKAPLTNNGHLAATTDPRQIADSWIRWPDALIGGRIPPDVLVVDIDPRNGPTLESFQGVVGECGPTMTVTSGRGDGGVHLYYRRNVQGRSLMQLDLRRHHQAFPGIDIKKDGYMIMPPSLHPDTGEPYTWGGLKEPQAPPSGLWLWLTLPPYGEGKRAPRRGTGRPSQKALAGILRRVATETSTRNNVLHWGACRLVENGYPETAYDALEAAAVYAGLPLSEIAKTINSARRAVA